MAFFRNAFNLFNYLICGVIDCYEFSITKKRSRKNSIIKNLNLVTEDENTKVFHSGTSLDNQNNIIASGGRVLAITSKDKNFNNAKKKVYEVVKKIKWKNSFFRKDIGFRAKKLK